MMILTKQVNKNLSNLLILGSVLPLLSIFCQSTTTGSTTTATPSKYKTLDSYPKVKLEITDSSDNYKCLSTKNKCEKIIRYYVTNVTYNCYQENIEIMFDTQLIIPDQAAAVTGYLKPYGFDNKIEAGQNLSKICGLIKR
jgi:hypothetical protein